MTTLEFKGKQFVYAHHLTIPYRPLVPDMRKSVGSGEEDDNLIIHGDNLNALKALLPRYAGRVNLIYIDPPYNTGNEGWIYNDNVNSPLMQEWLKQNSPVDGEDLERHDKWLCMMWPRMHLLKQLLAEDGVIFISINDIEEHHLRMLLDEIFGEGNFYSRIAWESRTKPTNMGSARFNIQSNTESILVYGNKPMTDHKGFNLYPAKEKKYPFVDNRGEYRKEEFQQRRNLGGLKRDRMVYSISDISPREGYRWQVSKAKYEQLENELKLIIEGKRVYQKIYSFEEDVSAYEPFWGFISKDFGTSESGKSQLNEILGVNHGLETVKPSDLIRKLVFHTTSNDDIILDSFAGSGTTAQAVLEQNELDGGNRKFILVECEAYADEITAERIRHVIRGVPEAKDEDLRRGVNASFTYCTLGEPINLERMLTGEDLPSYSALGSYLLNAATGISTGDSNIEALNNDGLFFTHGDTDFYLLYEPDLDWLRNDDGFLTEERAKRISRANDERNRSAVVFGTGKYMGQRDITPLGITFCLLPYEIRISS